MDREKIRQLLEAVAAGALTPAQALERLRTLPFEDLRFARVDLHRSLRHGVPEAVLCQGKSPEQVVAIARRLAEAHDNILCTRADAATVEALRASGLDCRIHAEARLVVVKPRATEGVGLIVVVSAGTADFAVAEEAALASEAMGNRVERLYDCGVAGLHRLVPHLDLLNEANVIVAVAGMEGALPSVIGGLVDRPVIAVPTSAGYGASLGGIAALLAMLNSCAPGVSVVNIDNGYGAAAQANQINKLASKVR
ncbi:MAG TPA: nickel pincer cofactor biosynthesis protein LarB [Methylomirabilota bacterium]|nr:nickel pincer cofactor biosynthesis protein LarB [Methylomirabilota bacterium]